MKLIGAGLARTGTMSLQSALDKLGYRSYHMLEAITNFEKGHLDMWNAYMEGRSPMDWHKLFEGYEAATDLPACIYYHELMEAFPEARVILTVRDPEAWWKSYARLLDLVAFGHKRFMFVPRFREFHRLFRNIERTFFNDRTDRESSIARFNQHIAEVKAAVPPEKLLVFDVREGWEPLCRFLGVPVPDEPFPHENAGIATLEKRMRSDMLRDILKMAWPVLVGIVAVVAIIIYLLTR